MTEPAGYEVVRTEADMAPALAALQAACFPTLSASERMRPEHFRKHVEVFPEGQLAVVDASGRPVASSTDFRTRIDFAHFQHRYMDAVADNWLTRHDPAGDWMYGADIGVHPDHRGRGLSTLLYDARHALVRRLGLRGHVEGAMPKGYGAVAGTTEVGAADAGASVPSIAADKAAIRAADRRASSTRDRQALMPNAVAAATDAHVRTMSTVSMLPYRSVNSTATSTITSTGVPRSVEGANRH